MENLRAAELRIGNFVQLNNNITQVDVIDYNQIIATEFGLIELKYIKPILLTEEWLLKFGFGDITEQCASKSINIKTFCKSFTVKKCNEQQTLFIELGKRGWTFKRVGYPLYNYVHQLQNLYFALTSKELIKTD